MAQGYAEIEKRMDQVLSNLPGRPLAWALRAAILPLGLAKGPDDALTRECAELLLKPSPTHVRLAADLQRVSGSGGQGDADPLALLTRAFALDVYKRQARVCLGAEKHPTSTQSHHRLGETFTRCDETIALAAMYAANHFPGVKAIIALTESGHTPLIMSRIRSGVPIYCYSPHSLTQNRVTMFRGVYTIPFAPSDYEPCLLYTSRCV